MLSNWWYTMLYSNRRTRADPSRAASQPGTRKLVYANLFAIRQHRGLNSWIVGRVRTLDWLFAFINNASEFINNESAATRRSTWHTENSFLDVRHLGIIRRLLQQEMTDHVGHSSAMRTNGVGAGPENAINNFFLCCLTCTLQAAVWLTKTENIERGFQWNRTQMHRRISTIELDLNVHLSSNCDFKERKCSNAKSSISWQQMWR